MAVPLWKYRICYYPAPKVANTSIKHALYQLKTGKPYEREILPNANTKHIHMVYKTPVFTDVNHSSYDNLMRFAVVRYLVGETALNSTAN